MRHTARRRGLLGDGAAPVLGRFVFHLAMPAALFMAFSAMPLSRLAGRSLIVLGASTAVVAAPAGSEPAGCSAAIGSLPVRNP